MRRSSGTHAIPAQAMSLVAARVMSRSPNRIVPRRDGVNPRIDRSMVVLPAPVGPSNATAWPGRTVIDAPNSAWVSP